MPKRAEEAGRGRNSNALSVRNVADGGRGRSISIPAGGAAAAGSFFMLPVIHPALNSALGSGHCRRARATNSWGKWRM
ncbi:hypothetical protein U9M48_005073 [Paspalum notatum var. saurae]|uniref:Uncharacterized protein n=1 Tax=Paspalum notatum var. saurae TaxID=547442 RepID=A0AAQ3SF91_PASNO